MDVREKVDETLRRAFHPELLRLEDDDGISGYVVSKQFRGVTSLDRQKLIDEALRNSDLKLTPTERRRVLAIAALTPVEYESLGPRS